ncbi:uncharacterized protein TNCV_420431 [Trichonephila clavipes]|uniref:Uncharacterized protein n=1 Tax=Trichonephila clavipes TaxID=2585209 RepID=A0A8X6V9X2_TRICX|nr:uncharacterized protein TNCV_420431 [Trichonephila clavipes]
MEFRQTIMAQSTVVDLYIEFNVIPTEFLVLPDAKGNKTLLGLDFFNAAEDITLSAFELRKDEGKNLTPEQARKINILLDRNEACFQPGGEHTPFIEHRLDTGDQPPVATYPYRMNPVKKQDCQKENFDR